MLDAVEGGDRDADGDQPDPAEPGSEVLGGSAGGREGHGEEGAEPEFPGPGVQAEVRPGRVRSGEQCARQCRGRGERDDRADGRSSAEAQGDQDERRPQDVELLLDGERPVVLDRGGGHLSGEVVGTPTGEHQVHGEARGREDVDTEFVESGWLEPDDRREAGGGEHRR